MSTRRVVAVVPDLFFAARVAETARAAGVSLESPPAERALEACRATSPHLVIVDLGAPGDPVGLVRALKADPATRSLRLVGFLSHVERERRDEALAAGTDLVLPRSAFTAMLPALLTGDSDEPEHSG